MLRDRNGSRSGAEYIFLCVRIMKKHEKAQNRIDFLSYRMYNMFMGGVKTMAKMGRPKSDNTKNKILSVRVEDSLYKRICDYAEQNDLTVTEVVLESVERLLKSVR